MDWLVNNLSQSVCFFENKGPFWAGFTTKVGGVNPDWGFNLGLNTKEPSHEVLSNRESFFKILGSDLKYAFANQIHSNDVLIIEKEGTYDGIDGFVTKKKGLVLNIQTADCLGILAVDVKNQVAGAFHAGWKGSAGRIVQAGIRKMLSIGAEIKEIQVFIAPGIKSRNYEVGIDLRNYFPENSFETNHGKLCLNLDRENIRQLEEIGISKIQVTPYSTFEEPNLFSYRKDAEQAGRFVSFIVLKGS